MTTDIFGKVSMGYIVIETDKLEDWRHFGEQGLGLHVDESSRGTLAFRMDSHQRRIILQKGRREDIVAIGWQVSDETTLEEVLHRLQLRDVIVQTGSANDAKQRGVKAFVHFKGPKGLPIELFVDPITADAPLNMLSSGFNTAECGMGHVAITSRHPDKMLAFWKDIFDARISDYVEQPMSGVTLDITFLRLNPRHHSVAVAATRGLHLDPIRTQIQHFNIEAKTLNDLTNAYRRCKEMGYKMAHGIGQHPNDKELSFYVLTPSGFELEMGWAPIAVNEDTWQTATHQAISSWGHRNEDISPLNRLHEARLGIRSLLKPEYTPY